MRPTEPLHEIEARIHESQRGWLAAILLALAVTLVYWPVVRFDFVNFDDSEYVRRNPHVQAGLTMDGVRWAFHTEASYCNFHPLTWLSLMLDAQLYGGWPGGFHLTNLLLHAGAALLLFAALQRMTQEWLPSVFVALLYAIHPLQAEPVAWIAERKGVLSTFFWMASLWAYGGYALRPSRKHMALVVAAMVLGLLAKQMVVTLPLVMLVLDYWPLRRSGVRALLKEKFFLFMLAAAFALVAYTAQHRGGATTAGDNVSWLDRVGRATVAYVVYLGSIAWPRGLYCPYLPPANRFTPGIVIGCLGLLTTISAVVWHVRRQRPYLLVGWMWYLVVALPVIGLVPLGINWRADRYMALPMVGILLAVVWSVFRLGSGWSKEALRAAGLAGAGAVVVLGVASHLQTRVWADSFALWQNTIEHDPVNEAALLHLGIAVHECRDYRGAERHYRSLLSLPPRFLRTRIVAMANLGRCLCEQERAKEGLAVLHEAAELAPNDPDIQRYLSDCRMRVSDSTESLQSLHSAIAERPSDPALRVQMGTLLLTQNQPSAAVEQLVMAVRNAPHDAEAHYTLGVALLRMHRVDEAIGHFRRTLAVDPQHVEARNNLGVALCATGRPGQAIDEYQAVIRQRPDYAGAHYNLANALVTLGRLSEAAAHYQEAARLSPLGSALREEALKKLRKK